MEPTDVPAPTSIELDRAQGLTLVWEDGTSLSFGLEELRVNCPCAECRGLREQGLPHLAEAGVTPATTAETAELVGGWGLTITWNDGHATGIYPWSLLRAWRG